VAPQNVCLAIAVKIAHALDLPGRVTDRARAPPAHDLAARHEPETRHHTAQLAPQNVCLAIAVKIAHALDLPGRVTDRARAPPPPALAARHLPLLRPLRI